MASVSIIICTRDRAASLARTLAAIRDVALPPGTDCEVLVVDNASTDDTEAVARAAQVRYLREPARGLARARNTGLAAARGDVLVFTDDDVRPEREWLTRLTAPILSGEAEAVAGGVRLAPHLARPWMSAYHRAWLAGTDDLDPQHPSRMVGANMAIARTVLTRVPSFDPELGSGALGCGEDTLFALQVREAGFRIAAALDAAVEHHFEESRLRRTRWLAAARRMGRSDAYLAYHWEGADWLRPWRSIASTAARQIAWFTSRGVPESLLKATRHLHACLHYPRERRRPRNYMPHGLVKLIPTP